MSLVDKWFETTLTREARAYVRNVIWELDKHRTVAESQGYSLIQVQRSDVSRTLSYVRKYKTWSIIGCLRYLQIVLDVMRTCLSQCFHLRRSSKPLWSAFARRGITEQSSSCVLLDTRAISIREV